MNLEKISTTIYDILGYVFPGFIVIFSLCVVDASFLHSHALYLQRFSKHPVFTMILAYVAGLICHVVAAWLKNRYSKQFTDQGNRLSTRIKGRVEKELGEYYGICDRDGDEFTTLETYQLAEAYNAVSGGFQDRDAYLAHEGLAKSGMVAVSLLAVTLFAAVFTGSAAVQVNDSIKSSLHIKWPLTLSLSLFAVFVAAILRARFLFFNRLKNNYTLLCFLARRQKEKANPQPQSPRSEQKKEEK